MVSIVAVQIIFCSETEQVTIASNGLGGSAEHEFVPEEHSLGAEPGGQIHLAVQ